MNDTTTTKTATEITAELAKSAILVTCTVRLYSGEKSDSALSREQEIRLQAEEGAFRSIKLLFGKNCPELIACKRAYGAVRTYVYDHTLPWSLSGVGKNKTGPRLLPLKGVGEESGLQVLKRANQLKGEAIQARLELEQAYDALVQQRKIALAGAFKAEDFPHKSALAGLFMAEVVPSPVPAMDDYSRIALPSSITDKLVASTTQRVERQMRNAMEDISKRALKQLVSFYNVLSKKGDGVKGASISEGMPARIERVANLMDTGNFSNDPVFEDVSNTLKNLFVGKSADMMRDDPQLCAGLAREAKRLADALRPLATSLSTPDTLVVAPVVQHGPSEAHPIVEAEPEVETPAPVAEEAPRPKVDMSIMNSGWGEVDADEDEESEVA